VVGYLVVSRPFFELDNPKYTHSTQSELMEDYYRSGRMLLNLAMAVGRLVLAGRELTRLAGYTARVTELQNVLKVCVLPLHVKKSNMKFFLLGFECGHL